MKNVNVKIKNKVNFSLRIKKKTFTLPIVFNQSKMSLIGIYMRFNLQCSDFQIDSFVGGGGIINQKNQNSFCLDYVYSQKALLNLYKINKKFYKMLHKFYVGKGFY